MKKNSIVIFLFIILFGCNKEKEIGPQTINEENEVANHSGVYILNEGNFGWSNGSISLYNPISKKVSNTLYTSVNNLPLGDIVQSMYLHNGVGYIVINNSGKIECVFLPDFKNKATISGLKSPRYFLPVSSTKAYVTDLYSNSISIIDLISNSVVGSIPVHGWTEKMLKIENEVFVTNTGRNQIMILNSQSDNITDSIQVSRFPNSIVKDKEGMIWVLCSGGEKEELPALYRINPISHLIVRKIEFSNRNQNPGKLTLNPNGTTLYYLNEEVYKLSVFDTVLPTKSFIESNGKLFYGLGVDPLNEDIYLSDAIDYIQSGTIYRYNNQGLIVDKFGVGIIPGEFVFSY